MSVVESDGHWRAMQHEGTSGSHVTIHDRGGVLFSSPDISSILAMFLVRACNSYDKNNTRISRLEAVVEGQLRLLGKLEWSCFGIGDPAAMCPVCMASTGGWHSPDCALAAALAEAKAVLAERQTDDPRR